MLVLSRRRQITLLFTESTREITYSEVVIFITIKHHLTLTTSLCVQQGPLGHMHFDYLSLVRYDCAFEHRSNYVIHAGITSKQFPEALKDIYSWSQ